MVERRDRYIGRNRSVTLRIAADGASDGATLESIYAVPYDTGTYLTEPEATQLVTETENVGAYVLGLKQNLGMTIEAGDVVEQSVALGRSTPSRPIDELLYPENLQLVRQLATVEESEAFDPMGRFDLWIEGDGLSATILDSLVFETATGERIPVTDACLAVGGTQDSVVLYGLSRSDLRDELATGETSIAVEDSEAAINTYYGLPYFGSDNFKTPEKVATLLETDDFLLTFSLFSRANLDPLPEEYTSYATTEAQFGTVDGNLATVCNGSAMWQETDEYAAIYPTAVSYESGDTAITTLQSQTNEAKLARSGIIARDEISEAASAGGYVTIGASGYVLYMAWDSDGDGYLDKIVTGEQTAYPADLKLERNGSAYTGSYSIDGSTWSTIATVEVPSPATIQEVGIFGTAWSEMPIQRSVFDGFSVE